MNLNQNNLTYPQIALRIESKDIINKLKLYNINFGAIKGLTIYNNISYDIYQNIFSYVNGFNNISFLDLRNSNSSKINSLEIINNFKSLKYLTLDGFKFENPFFIRLFDLIELDISHCDNIGFIEGNNTNYNLKKLEIRNSNIIKSKTIMRFSKLEDCTIYDKNIINHLFDPSFSMIKKLKCYEEDFLNSENKFLEDLNLMRNNEENDEEIFKKILNSKNLKKVDFENNLNIEKIAKLNGINYSMEELTFGKNVLDGNLIFLQDKFPNLKILSIDSNKNESNNVEVLENSKYQLNDITINNLSNIKIYCKSYYRLTKCDLSFSKLSNYKNIFPFNIKNNNTIFYSITYFRFVCYNIENNDNQFYEKLGDILGLIPNLKILDLRISNNNINQIVYMKLLGKIFEKKALDAVGCYITNKSKNPLYFANAYYTRAEIKKMFPSVNPNHFISLIITKLELVQQKDSIFPY